MNWSFPIISCFGACFAFLWCFLDLKAMGAAWMERSSSTHLLNVMMMAEDTTSTFLAPSSTQYDALIGGDWFLELRSKMLKEQHFPTLRDIIKNPDLQSLRSFNEKTCSFMLWDNLNLKHIIMLFKCETTKMIWSIISTMNHNKKATKWKVLTENYEHVTLLSSR